MLHKKALGDPGLFEEIFEVGIAYHGIQIYSSRVIFGQKHAVMRSQPLDDVRIAVAESVDLLKGIRVSLLKHGQKFSEDSRRTLRVIYCAMVIFQRDAQYFGNSIQGVLGMSGEDRPGDPQRIYSRIRAVKTLTSAILSHKSDIKSDIVADQHASLRKREESGQDLLDRISFNDHIIADPCQLCDPVRDRNARIDKFREAACDLAVFDPDSAELNDPVLLR